MQKIFIKDIKKAKEPRKGDLLVLKDDGYDESIIRMISHSNGKYYGYDMEGGIGFEAGSMVELIGAYKDAYDYVDIIPKENLKLTIDLNIRGEV